MGHLIYDKGGKNMQCRKHSLFNKWYWENWIASRFEARTFSNTKINSKWIKGHFNVRLDTKLSVKHRQSTP